MATFTSYSDHSTKVMEEGLTCCICYNFLREPKDLDCPHVYCLQCLQEWAKKKPTIECPECRQITAVPQGGLVNLKTNLRLKNIVEDYVKCRDERRGVPMCPNHEGERQHFFCVTCSITGCHNCFAFEHPRPQHDIKELKVIAQTQRTNMKTKMDHVQEAMETVNKEKQDLHNREGKLKAQREKARSDIKKRVQEIIAEGDKMMSVVETEYQHNMTTLQEEHNYKDYRLSQLQDIHARAHNVVDATSDHQFLQQQQSLVDQIDKLCLTQSEIPSVDSLQVKLESGLQEMTLLDHVTSAYSKETYKLTLVSEFGTFQYAPAVAVSSKTGLFAVVDLGTEKVSIYRKDGAGYKRQSFLGSSRSNGNMTSPTDVAATSEGKFLVSNRNVVKVFSPSGRYIKSWPIGANRIITTPDDLIVTVTGRQSKAVITVHQSNGELIRAHKVGCDNIRDIASNGKQIAFTVDPDKVCVIDFVTGQGLWTLNTMVMPLGICYEQKSNTLFVAGGPKETGQGVIAQFCSITGHMISRLASGLLSPFAMTVTQDNKLVVADWKTVKVYQIDAV